MKIIESIKNMIKRKSAEEIVKPKKEIIYPRYLSTAHHGEDLFDGKSQEKIKGSIEQFILDTDNPDIEMSEDKLPRLIGIEGKWGSGKSNVIKMLEDDSKLNANYIFFTYDAWGNQEDLQRKSILYMLTKQLIIGGYLTGKTKILQYNPQADKEPSEKECTWEERLQALTTNKSYTREISVPSINNSTKWFCLVLVIVGLIIGVLQIDGALAWWLNCLICISPFVLYFILLACLSEDDFKTACQKMFAMYETGAKTDTTSYVISENEPTIAEFKKWMQDLSVSLKDGKKLVLVFDNMDRLSKEKVHTLWSSIHTFFADSNNGYENVWCIIPYDAQHLSSAFEVEGGDKELLLQRFLQKTFPVIYRVPEPIVTDYKEVVDKLMHRAFGDKLHEEEYDIINRCYRLEHEDPNVREIIAFINELVQIYHTWHKEIDVVSMAVYILQKQNIANSKDDKKSTNSEKYIIDKEYEKAYSAVLKSRDSENMQSNIAALHYGVLPKKAYTIMLKRLLNGILEGKYEEPNALVPYLAEREHLSTLDEAFHKLDPSKYENVIKYFIFAEKTNLSAQAKELLQKFWNHMANDFLSTKETLSGISSYHLQVMEHLSVGLQTTYATHLIESLYRDEAIKGDVLYEQLDLLFSQAYAQEWDIMFICPNHALKPDEYMKYVHVAQNHFDKYPIRTDEAELNDYLQSLLTDDFAYVEEVRMIKDTYDLKPFVDKTMEVLESGKSEAQLVAKLLQIQRIFFDKFQSTKITEPYIKQLWASVIGQENLDCYPEILALKAFRNALGELPSEANHIAWMEERMYFYMTTAELFNGLPTKAYQYFIKLAKNVIITKNHDGIPTTVDWIKNWQSIQEMCKINREQIIEFAADWGYQLTENEKNVSIKTLLADPEWIVALKAEPITPLADSLLKKCASEIQACAKTEFVQNGTISPTNSYWFKALTLLIDTDYIPNTETGILRELVITVILYAAKGNKIENEVWLRVVRKCRFSAISTEMNELRRNILNKNGGYVVTPVNFAFLHEYLEKTEIDSESHRSDAANVIMVNIIDSPDCQKIIMQSECYKPIISKTKDTASELHEKIKAIEIANPESEFSKYLLELANYLPKDQDRAEDKEEQEEQKEKKE